MSAAQAAPVFTARTPPGKLADSVLAGKGCSLAAQAQGVPAGAAGRLASKISISVMDDAEDQAFASAMPKASKMGRNFQHPEPE